jgi:hypothetical protein
VSNGVGGEVRIHDWSSTITMSTDDNYNYPSD